MARSDLNQIILRVGELYVEMAMHCTIGAYIEDSGIDSCWEESGIFGVGAVNAILEGKHVKRGICAHLVTIQALLTLYSQSCFDNNKEIYLHCLKYADNLNSACCSNDKDAMRKTCDEMQKQFASCNIHARMKYLDEKNGNNPMFAFTRQYMVLILEMLVFLKSVRIADWELHLASLKSFCKYFFAFDKYVYARLIPLYIADMQQVKVNDPDFYQEFMNGNWIVNKNPNVPFCCLGAEHGLQPVNRMMKVSGGLVGITLNASARNRFFLVAPHLTSLAEEAELMVGSNIDARKIHHESGVKFQLTQKI